jgi:hypothetical protein
MAPSYWEVGASGKPGAVQHLGNYINACMIVSVFHDLGATHVYELVSASNVPSRRMVTSCGLRHAQGLVCGIATPNDSAHFTR